MFQLQQLLGTMDNITVSKMLLKCFIWVFLGTLFFQTVVSADTCVQTPCDNGHCCDKSGSSSASEKPCCCSRPPGGGFSITCSSHTSFRFAWW
ncbi:uncharacterized protein LOC128218891 isoform X2 [Mya arenaria]|uniref:uncharacterized protein LOC128218891 isoform X2 n=1 Tax=Mya arenaria TaxID=6604 RepID=UPI0022E5ECC3|nr:uncharacterized protein LOC128218891 isoform X2 [Mya arenaria]